jgi:hypothetical protein
MLGCAQLVELADVRRPEDCVETFKNLPVVPRLTEPVSARPGR